MTDSKHSVAFIKMNVSRDFLVVQWLGLHASNAEGTVQSLVGELRFYMCCDMAEKQVNAYQAI